MKDETTNEIRKSGVNNDACDVRTHGTLTGSLNLEIIRSSPTCRNTYWSSTKTSKARFSTPRVMRMLGDPLSVLVHLTPYTNILVHQGHHTNYPFTNSIHCLDSGYEVTLFEKICLSNNDYIPNFQIRRILTIPRVWEHAWNIESTPLFPEFICHSSYYLRAVSEWFIDNRIARIDWECSA